MGNKKQTVNKQSDAPVGAKKKLSVQLITLVTVGVILLGIIIAAVAMWISPSVGNDPNFDYLTSNISDYIYIPEEKYKDFALDLDIAKPHDIDVDVAILYLLNSKKDSAPLYDGVYKTNIEITPGDQVKIWYRGYLLDENGEEIHYENMCNFGSTSPSALVIGSNNFVPGFELGLVGKNPKDFSAFKKITEGNVAATDIAYISYSRIVEGGDEKKDTVTKTCERIDLSDTTLDDTYGVGFRTSLIGKAVAGDKFGFDVTIDGKTYHYNDVTVDFVTQCERENVITVKTYFPYDYNVKVLRNETVYFDVYVDGVQVYEAPEFNEEMIKELIEDDEIDITLEKLNGYEGADLVEKYYAYANEILNESYEQSLEDLIEEEMWNYLLSDGVAEVKKFPKNKVDAIYYEYREDVVYQYNKSGGSIYNSYTQEYESCENIDEFANIYLGIQYTKDPDWNQTLYTMSENLVKERLILYYILRQEDLVPTEAELNAKYDEITKEYLDEYMVQYLDSIGKDRDDYTDAEYDALVEDRTIELFKYFDDDYFYETAYYEIGLETFRTYPKVTTLDERSNFPQEK